MPLRIRPWQLATLLIVLCAGILACVYYFRHRIATSPADLVSWLPSEGGIVAWANIDALRDSGILDEIAGSRVTEDPEYTSFVEQTGFNYREDLHGAGLALRTARDGQKDVYVIAHGSFDWKRIYAYVKAHAGDCNGAFCHMPASRAGRYISLFPIRSDLMGFAVSSDPFAAYLITRKPAAPRPAVPSALVWILISSAALRSKTLLPEGTHAFASALEDANSVALSLAPSGNQLDLTLDADCRTVEDASRLLMNLEQTTDYLRRLIAREHQTPNPRDLSGVLTAGNFRRDDRRVTGEWPIGRPFIDAVVNGE